MVEKGRTARRRPRATVLLGHAKRAREMGQRGEARPHGKKKNRPRGLGLRWRREKERGEQAGRDEQGPGPKGGRAGRAGLRARNERSFPLFSNPFLFPFSKPILKHKTNRIQILFRIYFRFKNRIRTFVKF